MLLISCITCNASLISQERVAEAYIYGKMKLPLLLNQLKDKTQKIMRKGQIRFFFNSIDFSALRPCLI